MEDKIFYTPMVKTEINTSLPEKQRLEEYIAIVKAPSHYGDITSPSDKSKIKETKKRLKKLKQEKNE